MAALALRRAVIAAVLCWLLAPLGAVELRVQHRSGGWSVERGPGLERHWTTSAWGRILTDPDHLGWRWRLEQAGYGVGATTLPPGAATIADWFLGATGSWELNATAAGFASSVCCAGPPAGLTAIDPAMLQWIPADAAAWIAVGLDGPAFLAAAPQPLRRRVLAAVARQGEGWLSAPAEDLVRAIRGTALCGLVPGRIVPGVALALPRSPALDRLMGELLQVLAARPAGAGTWRVALLGDWWHGLVERVPGAWTFRSDAAMAWAPAAVAPAQDACLFGRWHGSACRETLVQACDLLAAQVAEPDRQRRLMGLVDTLFAGWSDGGLVLDASPAPGGRCDALPLPPLLLGMLLADGAWAPGWREFAGNDELAAARLRCLLLPELDGAAMLPGLIAKHASADDTSDGSWDGYRYRCDTLPADHAAAWICYAWPVDPPRSGRRCWALLPDGSLFSQVLGGREPGVFDLWGGRSDERTIVWAEQP